MKKEVFETFTLTGQIKSKMNYEKQKETYMTSLNKVFS